MPSSRGPGFYLIQTLIQMKITDAGFSPANNYAEKTVGRLGTLF